MSSRRSGRKRKVPDFLMETACTLEGADSSADDEDDIEIRERTVCYNLGFPRSSPSDTEKTLLLKDPATKRYTKGRDQEVYAAVRNVLLRMWWDKPNEALHFYRASNRIEPAHHHALTVALQILVQIGAVNFALPCHLAPKPPQHEGSAPVDCIVVGAGVSGLTAALHLQGRGVNAIVLEADSITGGRVRFGQLGAECQVDAGGAVVTGMDQNPLVQLSVQHGARLHVLRHTHCPLFDQNKPICKKLDGRVERILNQIMDDLARGQKTISKENSLGELVEDQLTERHLSADERRVLEWHISNVEYANGAPLSHSSAKFWDSDSDSAFPGDHAWCVGGAAKLVAKLREMLRSPVTCDSPVSKIEHSSTGVVVHTVDGGTYQAATVLCTVPLGVLKAGTIQFEPELPAAHAGAIKRLGFGLVNKVALRFDRQFWPEECDFFGMVQPQPAGENPETKPTKPKWEPSEGHLPGVMVQWWDMSTVAGNPVLVALMSGAGAEWGETVSDADLKAHALHKLRNTFGEVGEPAAMLVTRWRAHPWARGSYSFMAPNCNGDEYQALAQPLPGARPRVFFAGEHTNNRHPATIHGAYLSGLRAATDIACWAEREGLVMPLVPDAPEPIPKAPPLKVPKVAPLAENVESEEEDIKCQRCGSGEEESGDQILLCDGCDYAMHQQCCQPVLRSVPAGNWFCKQCALTVVAASVEQCDAAPAEAASASVEQSDAPAQAASASVEQSDAPAQAASVANAVPSGGWKPWKPRASKAASAAGAAELRVAECRSTADGSAFVSTVVAPVPIAAPGMLSAPLAKEGTSSNEDRDDWLD